MSSQTRALANQNIDIREKNLESFRIVTVEDVSSRIVTSYLIRYDVTDVTHIIDVFEKISFLVIFCIV